MNPNDTRKPSCAPSGTPEPSIRPGFRLAVIALLVAGVAGAGVYFVNHHGKPAAVASTPATGAESAPVVAPDSENPEIGVLAPPPLKETTAVAVAGKTARSSGPTSVAPAPMPEPSPQSRQLVASLSNLEQVGRSMTTEQAAAWKQNLQQLVQQGSDSVPAIAEFLRQNKDVDFGSSVSEALGYGSVRRAMFDALAQIGGPEGVAATRDVLQNSADPREIALLAAALDKMAPEEHRQEAVQAARDALSMAASGKLEGADVGPLFEVLQKYGGAAVAPELEQSINQWKYYAATALAQLPDGAGVPTLIQMAQGNTSAKINALEMLAQMSVQYPDAKAVLIDQARANKIPPNIWPYLVSGLVGDEYHFQSSELDDTLSRVRPDEVKTTHIRYGNQNLYSAPSPASLTAENINERMAFIQQLQTMTSDPAALKALQNAQDVLTRRLPSTAAVTP